MTDTTELKRLLAEVENATDRLEDETLARVWCSVKGVIFVRVIPHSESYDGSLIIHIGDEVIKFASWDRPDINLQAVDDLVMEVLPGWGRTSTRRKNGSGYAEIYDSNLETGNASEHPTSECLAILAALLKAKIAGAENV